MNHADAESPERVSGMATPLPNGIVQTIAAAIAAMNVKNPNRVLDVLKKAAPRKNIDIGRSVRNVTEA
jgi:hypothetical protein